MRAITKLVHPDESAVSLRELNLVRRPTHQRHRYQIVAVIRGDRVAEWWKDLGPAENFAAEEFQIPSLLEHTVGELWDWAQEERLGQDHFQRFLAEKSAESTLITDFLNQWEENRHVIHNRSRFGPGLSVQRNGFSRRAANEHARN